MIVIYDTFFLGLGDSCHIQFIPSIFQSLNNHFVRTKWFNVMGHLKKNSHLTSSYAYKKSHNIHSIRTSVRLSIRNIFVSAQHLGKTSMDFDALILMTSSLGLLSVNFCQFSTVLWPLNDVIISFLLNILSMNKWILIKFYALIFTTSSLGLLSVNFHQFVTELRPLNDVRLISGI